MKNNKIVYMGTPEFAVAPLKLLLKEGFNICAVVTIPDKPAGRGQKITQSDVKIAALAQGIKVLQPVSLKDPQFIEQLKELKAHLFIVVAFRMLPKEVWSIPKLGTFNLHSSLLPMYRGAAPINWAIINGETKSGVTTFLIDENIDTGKILFQQECEIKESDNAGDLHDKLMDMGAKLVVKSAKELINGTAHAVAQQESEEGAELKPAPKLNKESSAINWNRPCKELFNLIRGLSPYPAAHSILKNEQKTIPVKIFETEPLLELEKGGYTSTLSPGQIETDGKSFLRVGCAKGSLDIKSLQAAGKKRLPIKEFLSGLRDASSYCFIPTPNVNEQQNE